jgi:hypothetical protein
VVRDIAVWRELNGSKSAHQETAGDEWVTESGRYGAKGIGKYLCARAAYGVTDRKLPTWAMCTPRAMCAYEKNAASGRSAALLAGGIALAAIAEG